MAARCITRLGKPSESNGAAIHNVAGNHHLLITDVAEMDWHLRQLTAFLAWPN
jgi:hypothetical protein